MKKNNHFTTVWVLSLRIVKLLLVKFEAACVVFVILFPADSADYEVRSQIDSKGNTEQKYAS